MEGDVDARTQVQWSPMGDVIGGSAQALRTQRAVVRDSRIAADDLHWWTMLMTIKWKWLVPCIAAGLGSAAAIAQEAPPVPLAVSPSAPATTTLRTGLGDRFLATWLHNSCVNVVALARMAMEKAESKTVLAFARDAASDLHGVAIRLQLHSSLVADHAGAPEPRRVDEPRAMAFDGLTLLDELGNQHLQSHTALLSRKSGPDFDRGYLAMQVALLQDTVDLVEVARRFAGEPLRRSLAEIAVVVAKHRDVAIRLERQPAEPPVDGAPRVGRAR